MSVLTLLADSAPAPEVHSPQLIDVDGTVFVQLGLFLLLAVVLTRCGGNMHDRVLGGKAW